MYFKYISPKRPVNTKYENTCILYLEIQNTFFYCKIHVFLYVEIQNTFCYWKVHVFCVFYIQIKIFSFKT